MAFQEVYEFHEQHRVGLKGEHVLDAHFAQWYRINEATMRQQKLGIDRVFTNDKGRVWWVEYKSDYTAGRTGNAFIELVSRDTPPAKSGWVWTCQAHLLVFYIPGMSVAYIIEPTALKSAVEQWISHYPIKAIPNSRYYTYGLLVPISALMAVAKGAHRIDTIEGQAA